MTSLVIETVPINGLIEDPANARKHAPKNLEAIKGSLARFGQQKPIVVGKNNVVIAGNGTLQAARSLGWDDNRTGELAEWDPGILGETLKSLQDMDFDLEAIGFDDKDLMTLLPTVEPTEGLTDPDEVPEDVETRCKPGDLWVLGKHRLLCGDSTDVLQVERLMAGERPDTLFTDPPYGISIQADYGNRMKGSVNSKRKGLANNVYSNIIGDDQDFDPSFLLGYFQDAKIFLWGANNYTEKLPQGQWFVWYKKINDGMKKMFGWEFELCWTNQTAGQVYEHAWAGVCGHDKKLDGDKKTHPSMKSVQLLLKIFADYPGEKIADLYLGSGSTLIACEKTARRCFGMELDPKYCDVILARWEKFTGKTAIRHNGN